MKTSNYILPIALLALPIMSCKKMLEIDAPIESIVAKDVYDNTSTASAVLIGLYHDMAQPSRVFFATGENSLSVSIGTYADDLVDFTGSSPFFNNNLSEENDYYWTEIYNLVFRTNSAIEGLSVSSLIPEVKHQLIGEAKFMRAFYYFYLVNLFGDVPLLTTSDYNKNKVASRVATEQVYEQIIQDLKEAQELLGEEYVGGDILTTTIERLRPNKSAATALLARVYLYTSQWQNAEIEATKLIVSDKYSLTSLDSVFLKNSNEAIWQLQPVNPFMNTWDGSVFIPTQGRIGYYLTDAFIDKFDNNDLRKTFWIQQYDSSGLYYPFKYKLNTFNGQIEEYSMVLRLAEQYLIRAEARAQLNNIQGAIEDVYTIRNRSGLPASIVANTQSEILNVIADERQKELFTEWGHRWFDLKRTGTVNEILGAEKPSTWETWKQLFPIPKSEIEKNPSLVGHQNPGY